MVYSPSFPFYKEAVHIRLNLDSLENPFSALDSRFLAENYRSIHNSFKGNILDIFLED